MADLLQQTLDGLRYPLSEYTHATAWFTTNDAWEVAVWHRYGFSSAASRLDYTAAAGLAAEFNKLVRSMNRLKGAAHEQDG